MNQSIKNTLKTGAATALTYILASYAPAQKATNQQTIQKPTKETSIENIIDNYQLQPKTAYAKDSTLNIPELTDENLVDTILNEEGLSIVYLYGSDAINYKLKKQGKEADTTAYGDATMRTLMKIFKENDIEMRYYKVDFQRLNSKNREIMIEEVGKNFFPSMILYNKEEGKKTYQILRIRGPPETKEENEKLAENVLELTCKDKYVNCENK